MNALAKASEGAKQSLREVLWNKIRICIRNKLGEFLGGEFDRAGDCMVLFQEEIAPLTNRLRYQYGITTVSVRHQNGSRTVFGWLGIGFDFGEIRVVFFLELGFVGNFFLGVYCLYRCQVCWVWGGWAYHLINMRV